MWERLISSVVRGTIMWQRLIASVVRGDYYVGEVIREDYYVREVNIICYKRPEESEYPGATTDLPQVTDKLIHKVVLRIQFQNNSVDCTCI